MKKLILSLIFITIIASLAFFVLKGGHKHSMFKTEPVTRGKIKETITASGTVNPVTNISVGTQVSGTIRKLYVDFNSRVKKGQLLALIDPSLFEAAVNQAQGNLEQTKANLNNNQASLNNSRANLAKLQATLINDEKTYWRDKNLYKQNFIAKSQLDLDETTYLSDKAQVTGAKAQIAEAIAQIGVAKAQIVQSVASLKTNLTNLKYTKIVSPVNGVIVSRNVDIGQTVAASLQTPTLFMVAQDLTKMQIDTTVAEADVGKLREHEIVDFTLDGYPDLAIKGRIRQIRISPTIVQNVVTYDVVIDISNKDFKILPGMTANISVVTAKKANALKVPNAALRFIPHDENENKNTSNQNNLKKYKEPGVWIIGKKGRPKRITVKTGISDGTYTEIVSGKIHEREQVITGMLERKKGGSSGGTPRMF